MSASRKGIVEGVRGLLRLVNTKPFSDTDILRVIEYGIDDFSERAPFAVAVDRTHSVKGRSEIPLPSDVLEVIEAYYMDAAGAVLDGDITASSPANGGELRVKSATTDFPSTGVVQIDDEQISYSAKGVNKFIGITRGANNTIPVAHSDGSGVIEANKKWTLLTPRTTRQIAEADPTWLSNPNGVPDKFYVVNGVFGTNVPPNKNGWFNIMLRNLIRPPELTTDDSTIQGLAVTFHKAIVHYAASKLAQILAQDEAAIQQAAAWMQEYLADVAMFKKREHFYVRGLRSQVIPYSITRPKGI